MRVRLTAGFLSVLLLLIGSWALATPILSAPDEPSHVVKAAAVVRGELVGRRAASELGMTAYVRLPAVFGEAHVVPVCYGEGPEVTADCAPAFAGSRQERETPTWAGRYPPLYYLLVGIPSLPFPSQTGLYLMRLVSGALSAVFLAWALASSVAWPRSRLLVLGTVVAVTPMVLYLAASVNPSSIEISAAICLWVSALVVIDAGADAATRVLKRAGIAASVLPLVRPTSPLWLAIIGTFVTAVAPPGNIRALLARRDVRRWLAIVVVSLALALAWLVVIGPPDLVRPSGYRGLGLTQVVRTSLGKTGPNIDQMVGVFGALDARSPSLTYYAWFFAGGFVLVIGAAVATRRLLAAIIGALAGTVVLPVALEVPLVRSHDFLWQGRYTLPLAAGLPILAAFSIGRARVLEGWARRVTSVLAVLLGFGHVGAWTWALRRFSVGVSGPLNLLDARWQPPVPALVLLVTVAFATVQLGRLLALAASPPKTAAGPAPPAAAPTAGDPHPGTSRRERGPHTLERS